MNKVLFLIKLTLRCSAGDLLLEVNGLLPLRTNWLIVGIFIADHSLIGTLIFPEVRFLAFPSALLSASF
jgi:hypothetical protein